MTIIVPVRVLAVHGVTTATSFLVHSWNIFSKIYIYIINRRLTFYCDLFNKISEAQAGFRAGYSTIDYAYIYLMLWSLNIYVKAKDNYMLSLLTLERLLTMLIVISYINP